jgi:glycosyltransferase involved in cell wall biosynthesis
LHGPIQAQDLADYLHSVSYLIIPSRIESIPVIFSDALQIGTPVVTMPAGDLAEMVRDFGCGIVAKEVTAYALARALEEAMTHDRTAFAAGVRQAYQQFRLRNTVVSWLNYGQGGQRTTAEN